VVARGEKFFLSGMMREGLLARFWAFIFSFLINLIVLESFEIPLG